MHGVSRYLSRVAEGVDPYRITFLSSLFSFLFSLPSVYRQLFIIQYSLFIIHYFFFILSAYSRAAASVLLSPYS